MSFCRMRTSGGSTTQRRDGRHKLTHNSFRAAGNARLGVTTTRHAMAFDTAVDSNGSDMESDSDASTVASDGGSSDDDSGHRPLTASDMLSDTVGLDASDDDGEVMHDGRGVATGGLRVMVGDKAIMMDRPSQTETSASSNSALSLAAVQAMLLSKTAFAWAVDHAAPRPSPTKAMVRCAIHRCRDAR